MNKSMIMYFSMSGTTREAALELQQKTSGQLFEIKAKVPYPTAYEDYAEVGKKQLDNNIEPELDEALPNLDDYDLIYLGFPTWWQQPPMIIHTVLKDAKLKGKTIVPFTTSMNTGIEESTKVIRSFVDQFDVIIKDGFRFNPTSRQFSGKTNLSDLI